MTNNKSKRASRLGSPLERILRRIRVGPEGPDGERCWLWEGKAKTIGGYGQTGFRGKKLMVHRVTYTELVGLIPEGLPLDHLCRQRLCVNPKHLEPVTQKENVRRGHGNGRKTHCPQGHPLIPANLVKNKLPYRACRICVNEKQNIRKREERKLERELRKP